ncbi:aminotransferase class I/II-fold pyridoxal phosphate-dependent enzyme [Nocardia brasiliensis]|uniref:aminotransferase class I/II-fold pyridoxal phosphate-dependent enzyme n=1 Tax=Nocardia brasiliensis TaxID=37326 RepID=UPI0024572720|nr:aminotransferase class I/II-fold pyridoxal phosphate-dependent enzyme [Nocardia brasiliensis]
MSLFEIMAGYEKLEEERRTAQGRPFLSDYHGGHPFVGEYLGALATTAAPELGDVTRYAAVDEDDSLRAEIAEFHRRYDGVRYLPEQVLVGGGSSTLLGTFCTWLMLSGRRRIHYLPPVYYKFAYLFRQYGIEPVAVADMHACQPGFELRLPCQPSLLILTDPIWYTGRPVPVAVLEAVRSWQVDTGSLVFVDGTFEYMRWDGGRAELAAGLVSELTIRMVCPTKFLSLHGYRCAWLLTPIGLRDELFRLHLNLHGEISLSDRLFAHRACEVMLNGGNQALLDYVRDNYHTLLDRDAVTAAFDIETGYFLFAEPTGGRRDFLTMDQEFFELRGYPRHVRINLLNTTALQLL